MSQFFTSGGQSIGVSASATVLPMNIQDDWFPLGWTGWISLQSKGLKRILQHHNLKSSILHTAFFMVQLSHLYVSTGETIALTIQTFVGKMISMCFNALPRSVIAILPRSVSFNFMAPVTTCSAFGAQENKIWHCFHFFPRLFAMKWWDQMPWS